MKKTILTALLVPAMALAQNLPTPTFNSLTLQNPLSAANGGTGATTATGSGSAVLSNSPTLVTPALGTPSAVTLTNGTGLPVSSGISGLGTGVATGLSNAVTGSGGPVLATSPTIASPTVTGAFTATGLVTLADHATQAANTIIGNGTGSSASPTAIAMPSCSASGSYLGWTSGTGFGCSTAYPASAINYGAGITPLSGISLAISLFGETAGTEYVAGGGLSVSDSSSHASKGHTAYSFTSTPIGTGAIGPTNADFAFTVSLLKQNFSGAATAGEIDGAYYVVRNGGSNSDTTGFLVDVGNYGTGFNAVFEGKTSSLTTSSVVQAIDSQVGVVDTRAGAQYGYVATKDTGVGGIAFNGTQSTSGGGGQWQHLMQFSAPGSVLFDMPISSGNVVSQQMFDGSGGSKTFGVAANCFYINNAANSTQEFSVCDNGSMSNNGSFTTGATTVNGTETINGNTSVTTGTASTSTTTGALVVTGGVGVGGAINAGSVTTGNLTATGTVSGSGFTSLLSPYAPLASPTFTGTVTTGNLTANGTATINGSIKNVVTPTSVWGFDSTGSTVTIANGGNAVLSAGNGIITVEESVGSQSAIYLCSASACTMIGEVGGAWSAPTTTPTAGHLSVNYNGSTDYAIYNNQGGSETVTVNTVRMKATN